MIGDQGLRLCAVKRLLYLLVRRGRDIARSSFTGRSFTSRSFTSRGLADRRAQVIEQGEKGFYHVRVALYARRLGEHIQGLVFVERRAIWPVGRERAVELYGAKYARADGDIFKREHVGIARTVPPFVVPAHEQLSVTSRVALRH